jgi:hypothetical protein
MKRSKTTKDYCVSLMLKGDPLTLSISGNGSDKRVMEQQKMTNRKRNNSK